MFIAMCNYFCWDIADVSKPFESDDAWTWESITAENSEDDADTSSSDEDSPTVGSFMNEPTEEAEDTAGDSSGEEDVEIEAGEDTGISAESE